MTDGWQLDEWWEGDLDHTLKCKHASIERKKSEIRMFNQAGEREF